MSAHFSSPKASVSPVSTLMWVMVVVTGGVSAALHIGKLPLAIPLLREELGMSLVQAGFLLSLIQLAGMILGVLIGSFADRLGAARVMVWGLVLLALASALGALVDSVTMLLLSRMLEGIGFLLTVVSGPALLRAGISQPQALARAMGAWGCYMPTGATIALLTGTALVQAIGWRGTWLLLGLLTLAAALWLAAAARQAGLLHSWGELGLGHSCAQGQKTALSHDVSDLARKLRLTLSARGPWLPALGFAAYTGQWLTVIGFLPTIYQAWGYSAAALGTLTAAASAINIVGNLIGGQLAARGIKPWVVLSAGFGTLAVCAVLIFSPSLPPTLQYGAVLLFSMVGGVIPGTMFGLAVRLAVSAQTVSTSVGWMQQMSSISNVCLPPIAAVLTTAVGGWHWTWAVFVLCSAAGIVLAQLIRVELTKQ